MMNPSKASSIKCVNSSFDRNDGFQFSWISWMRDLIVWSVATGGKNTTNCQINMEMNIAEMTRCTLETSERNKNRPFVQLPIINACWADSGAVVGVIVVVVWSFLLNFFLFEQVTLSDSQCQLEAPSAHQ